MNKSRQKFLQKSTKSLTIQSPLFQRKKGLSIENTKKAENKKKLKVFLISFVSTLSM